jgi:transmembrane sensor
MRNPFTHSQFIKLVRKYIAGKASQKEQAFLHNYYEQFENRSSEFSDISQEDLSRVKNEMKNAIWSQAVSGKAKTEKRGILVYFTENLGRTVAAAAVLIAVFSASLMLWFTGKNKVPVNSSVTRHQPSNQIKHNQIQPGFDKAILTLSDGSIITLDSTSNGILSTQSNATVSNSSGRVVYKGVGISRQEEAFNKIATSRGGQYQIVLSDGTKVWLNASSSLHYPVAFSGKERKVELTGEAYFEVAKNPSQPFIVKVKDVDVKVLGTHFNIMSFDDEDKIATTLLEGAVNVTKGDASRLMKPGQQLSCYTAGKIEMKNNVDVGEVIAWKNGKFHFVNADIKTIMRQLSRWYNIDVSYEGEITETMFGGMIGRKENVTQLLKIFELTGKVHFKINGTKITVIK